jgi:microcystin-dependent protein
MVMAVSGSVGVTYPDATIQTSASTVPAGTLMLFVQTAAPTGWTKSTTHDNKALRIVSGSAGTGGSVAFTTAFASGLSAGATTLSTAQMPAHTHAAWQGQTSVLTILGQVCGSVTYFPTSTSTSGSQGGGGSHDHTLPSFAVQYVDVIIATKN